MPEPPRARRASRRAWPGSRPRRWRRCKGRLGWRWHWHPWRRLGNPLLYTCALCNPIRPWTVVISVASRAVLEFLSWSHLLHSWIENRELTRHGSVQKDSFVSNCFGNWVKRTSRVCTEPSSDACKPSRNNQPSTRQILSPLALWCQRPAKDFVAQEIRSVGGLSEDGGPESTITGAKASLAISLFETVHGSLVEGCSQSTTATLYHSCSLILILKSNLWQFHRATDKTVFAAEKEREQGRMLVLSVCVFLWTLRT